MTLTLETAWDRPNTTGDSEHWLSVVLRGLTPASSDGPVALLVDTSSSMVGSRLAAVRKAVVSIVREIPPTRRIGVWSFSTKPKLVWEGAGGADIEAHLVSLEAAGRTGLGLAFDAASAWFGTSGGGDIFVFTDGDPTDSEGRRADTAPLCDRAGAFGRQGIRCSTFGIGNAEQFDSTFVRALADASGGVGIGCSRPEELVHHGLLALASRRAEQFSVVLEVAGADVDLVEAWRAEPRVQPLQLSRRTVSTTASEGGRILLRLRYTAPIGVGTGARLVGELVGTEGPTTVRVPLRLRQVLPSSQDRLELDPSVDQVRARIELTRIAAERSRAVTMEDQLRLTRHLSNIAATALDPRATTRIGEELSKLARGEQLTAEERARTVDMLREPSNG